MPEPVNNNPNPGGNNPGDNPGGNNPGGANPNGDDPAKNGNNGGAQPPAGDFDPSKLGDEQLNKVLEDPRLWNTPRLKELRDAQKELKTLRSKAEQEEQERLKKQGEYQTLAEQNEQKAKDWQTRYETSVINNAIMTEASKKGITDLDAATKLIGRDDIKVGENGEVTGVTEAVEALAKSKPYLVGGQGNNTPDLGGGTNPSNPGEPTQKFKMSEISDPVFYQKHEAEIKKAMATPGAIVEDRF